MNLLLQLLMISQKYVQLFKLQVFVVLSHDWFLSTCTCGSLVLLRWNWSILQPPNLSTAMIFLKGKFRAVNPSPGSLVFELLNFFLSLCKQLLSGAVTNLPRVYLHAFSG